MNGTAHPAPQFLIERQRALTAAGINLRQMLALHRAIASVNAFYRFDLPLAPESDIVDAISRCESLHKQTEGENQS